MQVAGLGLTHRTCKQTWALIKMADSLHRRRLLAVLPALALADWPLQALAQRRIARDSAVIGMTLEPPGLDPTSGAG